MPMKLIPGSVTKICHAAFIKISFFDAFFDDADRIMLV